MEKHITLGKTTFFIPDFYGKTKEWFIENYRGKINTDIDASWELIQQQLREITPGYVDRKKRFSKISKPNQTD